MTTLLETALAHPLVSLAEAKTWHRGQPLCVEGQARAVQTIAAPLSGRPVIGYQLRFTLKLRGEPDAPLSISGMAPSLIVSDGSQELWVETACAMVCFQREVVISSDDVGSAAAPLLQLLCRVLDPERQRKMTGSFTWSEHFLDPKEPVFIAGVAGQMLDSQGEGSYRASPYRPTICTGPRQTLFIADMHKRRILQALEGC